jgi:type II secretory pathway component PulJ
MTARNGVIVALVIGSIVGGTAGATIVNASSTHAETTASLQQDAR